MNRRKNTSGLSTDDVRNLNSAWHHARTIGLPLNTLVTFRPIDDTFTPAELGSLFAKIRNKIGVYARQHGFQPAFAWSREVNPDGTGEHLHMLVHIPSRWLDHFTTTAIGWMPDAQAVDVQRAHYSVIKARDGKAHSAVGYISKQMTPQAWWRRGLRRVAGGKILGKRGGVSANLDWAARNAYNGPPGSSLSPGQPKNVFARPKKGGAKNGMPLEAA